MLVDATLGVDWEKIRIIEEREQYELSLYGFVKKFWNYVESQEFIDNWHIKVICDHLQAVTCGRIKRLLINIPPGCSKSLLCCVFWPVWEWTSNPSCRWFFGSYDQRLSSRDSVKCRALIRSSLYQHYWGDVYGITRDQNQKLYYETTKTGYRLATSIGGHGTGQHPDRVVIDDPHSALKAESELERQAVIDWWDLTMSTRGVSRNASRVIIMQRLHENDLAGHVLKSGDFEHICHDDQTEVLTGRGWLKFSELSSLDTVAQVDPSDLSLSMVVPDAIQNVRYQGKMLSWQSDSLSMVVTPDHRVVNKKEHDVRVNHGMKRDWRITRAADLPNSFYVPQSAFSSARDVKYVRLGGKSVSGDDYCKFMGYYLSEGCFSLKRNLVVISQNEGVGCDNIRSVMRSAGLMWRESVSYTSSGNRHVQMRIRNRQLAAELSVYGKARDKFVPDVIKGMSVRQIRLFVECYRDGDGWVANHGGTGIRTSSRRMVDDMQELFVKIGWCCGVGGREGNYGLQQRVSKRADGERYKFWGKCIPRHKEEIDYNGMVYCVSVPTGAVMCRRNGKPFVSGNCLCMRHEPGRMVPTSLGFIDNREEGALLTPEQFPEDAVKEMEKNLGAYGTAGQLQQRPRPKGGGMFKEVWFRHRVRSAPYIARRIRYWDRAATKNESSCFTAGVLLAQDDQGAYYVEDVVHGKWEPDERNQVMRATAMKDRAKYGPNHEPTIYVEREGGSSGRDAWLGVARALSGFPVFEDTVTGKKDVRAEPWAAQLASGNVFIVDNGESEGVGRATWDINNYVKEHCSFKPDTGRLGRLKDIVDASTGAFNLFAGARRVQAPRVYSFANKTKHIQILLANTQELSSLIIDDRRCLLVTIHDPYSDFEQPVHGIRQLLAWKGITFGDYEPKDHQATWDDPVPPYDRPIKDLLLSTDTTRDLWKFLLKTREKPPEVIIVASEDDRRSLSLACGIADGLRVPRKSCMHLASRDDIEVDKLPKNQYVVDQTKAARDRLVM